jgi:hypothetical protein
LGLRGLGLGAAPSAFATFAALSAANFAIVSFIRAVLSFCFAAKSDASVADDDAAPVAFDGVVNGVAEDALLACAASCAADCDARAACTGALDDAAEDAVGAAPIAASIAAAFFGRRQ